MPGKHKEVAISKGAQKQSRGECSNEEEQASHIVPSRRRTKVEKRQGSKMQAEGEENAFPKCEENRFVIKAGMVMKVVNSRYQVMGRKLEMTLLVRRVNVSRQFRPSLSRGVDPEEAEFVGTNKLRDFLCFDSLVGDWVEVVHQEDTGEADNAGTSARGNQVSCHLTDEMTVVLVKGSLNKAREKFLLHKFGIGDTRKKKGQMLIRDLLQERGLDGAMPGNFSEAVVDAAWEKAQGETMSEIDGGGSKAKAEVAKVVKQKEAATRKRKRSQRALAGNKAQLRKQVKQNKDETNMRTTSQRALVRDEPQLPIRRSRRLEEKKGHV